MSKVCVLRSKNKTTMSIISPLQDMSEKAVALRKFVRDDFFPALCAATTSINDADIFLQSFSTMLMENFLQKMKEMPFAELKLHEQLDPTGPKHAEIDKMVKLFDAMPVKEAQDVIEGMKTELRDLYRRETMTRSLDSLKTNWMADEPKDLP